MIAKKALITRRPTTRPGPRPWAMEMRAGRKGRGEFLAREYYAPGTASEAEAEHRLYLLAERLRTLISSRKELV